MAIFPKDIITYGAKFETASADGKGKRRCYVVSYPVVNTQTGQNLVVYSEYGTDNVYASTPQEFLLKWARMSDKK